MGERDVYVMQLNPADGSTMWISQFGTPGFESLQAIAVDTLGFVYAAGSTYSAFKDPNVTSKITTNDGDEDSWVVQLDQSQGKPLWVTQFGTESYENITDIMVNDNDNSVYVLGSTNGFFKTPTATRKLGGDSDNDAFVLKIDGLTHTQQWVTQFGTANWDTPASLSLEPTGVIKARGTTSAKPDSLFTTTLK